MMWIVGVAQIQAQKTGKEINIWQYALECQDTSPLDPVKFRDDPLDDITDDMKTSSDELGRLITDEPLQSLQENIISKFDKLIAGMQQECSACSGGKSGAQPMRPAAKSVIMGGPGGSGDLHSAKEGHKKWADLPDQERDQIIQSLNEGFPAGYELILERYFRNLAEEKVGGNGNANVADSDQ